MARKTRKALKEIESGIGIVMSIFQKILRLIADRGVTPEQIRRLDSKAGDTLLEKIADAVAKALEPVGSAMKRLWKEHDGVIYFSVTSDGTTGEEWITRLESKGFSVCDSAKRVLRSPDFKPTGDMTTEVAVLKGMVIKETDRITSKVRVEAHKRMLGAPQPELACLIREKFTTEEIGAMGLWRIVAMHESTNDSDSDLPDLLDTGRYLGGRWLSTCNGKSDRRWFRDDGFAFVASYGKA